jgi:hypothetical protein
MPTKTKTVPLRITRPRKDGDMCAHLLMRAGYPGITCTYQNAGPTNEHGKPMRACFVNQGGIAYVFCLCTSSTQHVRAFCAKYSADLELVIQAIAPIVDLRPPSDDLYQISETLTFNAKYAEALWARGLPLV